MALVTRSLMGWFALVLVASSAAAYSGGELKIHSDDGHSYDSFGQSLDMDGSLAIIGVPGEGTIHVLETTGWQRVGTLSREDAPGQGAGFGSEVRLSGPTAIAGTAFDHVNGTRSGSAYLFNAQTGQQTFKLIPADNEAFDFFGGSVDVSGNLAVVGAYQEDEKGHDAGAVYVFDTTTGQELRKWIPSPLEAEDYFGTSVAIDGDRAVVGAPGSDISVFNGGAAYVFDTTTLLVLGRLSPGNLDIYDSFGMSVAVSGRVALVGAPGDDDNGDGAGAAYLYDLTTGDMIFKLTPEDARAGHRFGFDVAIEGDIAIVGVKDDLVNGSRTGSAYLFDTNTGQQIAKLVASDGESGDEFGGALALEGSTVLIGARGDEDFGNLSGSAYVYCACPEAAWTTYGDGWPGTLGVPSISATANPELGSTFMIQVGNSRGVSTSGFLFFGYAAASIPTLFDGTLLVVPTGSLPITIPAAGLDLPVTILNDPALCGLWLFQQVLQIDPGASAGLSFTQGLHLTLGV